MYRAYSTFLLDASAVLEINSDVKTLIHMTDFVPVRACVCHLFIWSGPILQGLHYWAGKSVAVKESPVQS